MSNSKNHTPSKCLCTILHHLICSNNLSSPLHPLTQLHNNPHHHHHHDHHDYTSAIVDESQTSEEPRKNPGIVARLMGLDSLPNPRPHQNYYESLYRSKSLNSLKFLLDFDPARVSFHRRAATSASFRERQIGGEFFVRNEENPDLIARKRREAVNIVKQNGKERREKMVMLKEDVRIRGSREKSGCKSKTNGGKYYQRRNTNNYPRNKIKKSAEILQSDVPSRSPVSVLDHRRDRRTHGFDSPSKGDPKLVISSSRRKSSGNKLKSLDEKAPQGVAKLKFQKKHKGWNYGRWEDSNCIKAEMEMVGYFGVISRQVSKLVEEEISDPKRWSIKYQMLKIGFMQHFCQHFSLQILDFLLDELMHELIVN